MKKSLSSTLAPLSKAKEMNICHDIDMKSFLMNESSASFGLGLSGLLLLLLLETVLLAFWGMKNSVGKSFLKSDEDSNVYFSLFLSLRIKKKSARSSKVVV